MQAFPQGFPFLQRLPNHENPPPEPESSPDTLVEDGCEAKDWRVVSDDEETWFAEIQTRRASCITWSHSPDRFMISTLSPLRKLPMTCPAVEGPSRVRRLDAET
jgi:hypothetical protein